VGKLLRLKRIGRVFESRGGIITFYLFYLLRFLSHCSLYYLPLIQLTSISVIIRVRWFPCDHGAATHSCIMHDTGRGRLCTTGIQFSIFGSIRCLAVSNYFGSGDFQFVLLPPPKLTVWPHALPSNCKSQHRHWAKCWWWCWIIWHKRGIWGPYGMKLSPVHRQP